MIKLPTISAENVSAFHKDVFKSIKELLVKNSENPLFERIICYCSIDGQLNDSRIERLIIGDIMVLTDAISQIGATDKAVAAVVLFPRYFLLHFRAAPLRAAAASLII